MTFLLDVDGDNQVVLLILIGGGALAFVLAGLLLVLKSRRRAGGRSGFSMDADFHVQDVDALARRGVLTPDERRRVMQAVARREMTREENAKHAGDDRELMSLLQSDPEAARDLLAKRERQSTPKTPPLTPSPTNKTPGPSSPTPRKDAPKSREGAAPKSRELDILLEKGAISREDYDRLTRALEP